MWKVLKMRDVHSILKTWFDEGNRLAIAIVINTWGSSPRKTGSWMIVKEGGEFQGSVSGGCVESAVIDESLRSIETKRSKLLHFGVSDETAWDVGLACGGEIDVFIRPFPVDFKKDQLLLTTLDDVVTADAAFKFVIVLDGPREQIGRMMILPDDGAIEVPSVDPLASSIIDKSTVVDRSNPSKVLTVEASGSQLEVFFHFFPASPKLIIVGGAHISMALSAFAKILGYRVYIIDPRGLFGTAARFPDVDELISAWPDQGLEEVGLDGDTAVAILSHDPKLDDPALRRALQSDAFYVGALGSRRTQEKRRERLIEHGLAADLIERLHAPVGLDLGGSSPEEIALSILAEITAIKYRKDEIAG